MKELYTEQLYL